MFSNKDNDARTEYMFTFHQETDKENVIEMNNLLFQRKTLDNYCSSVYVTK